MQQIDALNVELDTHAKQAAQRETELDEARATENRLRERYAVLSEVRASLSGFDAGTRAVMNAQLPGVRGVLATLINVDSDWERAIEAALGPDIQAIVVESWSAAPAVRDLLGDSNGRVSLLPLDWRRTLATPPIDATIADRAVERAGLSAVRSAVRGRDKPTKAAAASNSRSRPGCPPV